MIDLILPLFLILNSNSVSSKPEPVNPYYYGVQYYDPEVFVANYIEKMN